jgi:hypothetical protein
VATATTTAFDADKHIIRLQGKEYILFPGLVALAKDQGMVGMQTAKLQDPTEENNKRCVFEATASFLAYDRDGELVTDGAGNPLIATYTCQGDASPADVSRGILPHMLRMAETRAMARALRVGTGLAITAFEELGSDER